MQNINLETLAKKFLGKGKVPSNWITSPDKITVVGQDIREDARIKIAEVVFEAHGQDIVISGFFAISMRRNFNRLVLTNEVFTRIFKDFLKVSSSYEPNDQPQLISTLLNSISEFSRTVWLVNQHLTDLNPSLVITYSRPEEIKNPILDPWHGSNWEFNFSEYDTSIFIMGNYYGGRDYILNKVSGKNAYGAYRNTGPTPILAMYKILKKFAEENEADKSTLELITSLKAASIEEFASKL